MKRPLIGHNRPPFESAADLPEDIPKLHYFKLDIQALRKAIFDKPLEQRGAFISVLLAMYEFMEPLPADDNVARMRCGIMDIRVYRRVKRELVDLGLAHLTLSGRLSNRRFEDEIAAYVTDFVTRQRAAKESKVAPAQRKPSEALGAEIRASYTPTSGEPKGVAKPELSMELNHDLSEKTSNFNGGTAASDVLRARVLELELELEREKRSISEGGAGELAPPADVQNAADASPSKDQSSTKPKPPRVKREASIKTPLPSDWLLPKPWGEWALANYMVTPDAVRTEAARFRDHWISTGVKRVDWEATWRNWCRSDIGKKWKPRDGINGSIVDGDLLSVAAEPVDDGWAEVRELNRLEREREQ